MSTDVSGEMTLAAYKAATNEFDVEDCGACLNDSDACLWHNGFDAGVRWAAKVAAAALEDADLGDYVWQHSQSAGSRP